MGNKNKYNKNNKKEKYDRETKTDFKGKSADEQQATSKKEFKDRKSSSKDRGVDKEAKMNDARWYMPSDKIMQNFNYALEGFLGKPTSLSYVDEAAEDNPTVMSIDFVGTPGDTSRDIMNFSVPSSAAINVAARVFFTSLASENKKPTNYQPQDIALAIFAESQLIAMMSMAVRLYGIALQFNMMNRDIPRMLIAACGIDPDSFGNAGGSAMSLSDYRDAYNLLAQQANSLPFVGGIKEFEKSWAMFSSYYCDNPINTAQLYVPTMSKVGKYIEEVSPDDPDTLIKTIEYEDIYVRDGALSNLCTAQSFLTKIKHMLDNLNTSSLMNYVYPDILNFMRTKGASNFVFPLLSDMYVLPPVYNELFLTQIHNLNIPGRATFNPITQDPTRNIIETHITWSSPYKAGNFGQYVDFPFTAEPTIEEKIDALIFKTPLRGATEHDGRYVPGYQSCSDYVPVKITVYGCNKQLLDLNGTSAADTQATDEYISSVLSKFKCAPLIYIFDNTTKALKHTIGSLDTFSVVNYGDIKPLLDQAILGLFTYDAEHTLSDFNGK